MTKKFMSFFVFFALLASAAPFAHGADLPALERLFKASFSGPLYNENKAGMNMVNFLRAAMAEKIDLTGVQLVQVTNSGVSNLGFVKAYKARSKGKYSRETKINEPGEANWEYHAFLVVDGHVLDFDFNNEPTVTSTHNYLLEMYTPHGLATNKEATLAFISGYVAEVGKVHAVNSEESATAPVRQFIGDPERKALSQLL